MELEEDWRRRSLEQLEQFRVGFSREQWLEDYVPPVKRIKVSSVDAVFSLPRSIDGHNLHLEDLQEFFLAHQVLRVLLDGVCILDLQVCTFTSNTTCSYMSHIIVFLFQLTCTTCLQYA